MKMDMLILCIAAACMLGTVIWVIVKEVISEARSRRKIKVDSQNKPYACVEYMRELRMWYYSHRSH